MAFSPNLPHNIFKYSYNLRFWKRFSSFQAFYLVLIRPDNNKKDQNSFEKRNTILVNYDKNIFNFVIKKKDKTKKSYLFNEFQSIDDFKELVSEELNIDNVKVTTNEGHEIADACLFKNAVQLGFKLSAKDLALYFQHKENSLFNKEALIEKEILVTVQKVYPVLIERLIGRKKLLQEELFQLNETFEGAKKLVEKKVNLLVWSGLVEPVTYFLTSANAVFFYALFASTKEEYNFSTGISRHMSSRLYKWAQKENFNIERYFGLLETLADHEEELKRLNDLKFLIEGAAQEEAKYINKP